MSTKKTFEIYLIRKIPYLTNVLGIICFLSLSVFLVISYSISGLTPEMKAFYLIETSGFNLLYGSGFVSVFAFILYLLAKLKRRGLLVFNPDSFELLYKREQQLLPFESIRRVYCNDSENREGEPNKKFAMTIETWKNKKIVLRIRNTNDILQFTNKLLNCVNLKIDHINSTLLD